MGELSGLELRKAALSALGWRESKYCFSISGGWHHPKCSCPDADAEHDCACYFEDSNPHGCDMAECDHFHDECSRTITLAIESDPAVSEPLFLEWCAKNYYEWQMNICNPHDKFSEGHIAIWVHDHDDRVDIESDGATPSEARARVIVAVAKAGCEQK